MKKTIRNFQSISIKLIFVSVLYFISADCKNIKGNFIGKLLLDTNTTSLSEIPPIYSKENISQTFYDSINYFIVLKNNKNCMNCFGEINQFIQTIKKTYTSKFIAISLIDSTTLDRKRNFYENKKLMPDIDDFFFQYRNNSNNFFFDNLSNGYTPEIIILKNGKIFRIPYQEIFEFESLEISQDFKIKIIDLLK